MHCYLLCVSQASTIDRHSNNSSLFCLVEQINVPEATLGGQRRLLPLEVHAYFEVPTTWSGQAFEMRLVLVAASGLETFSDNYEHRAQSGRLRVKTLGLPQPPVFGPYSLRVEVRPAGQEAWQRQPASWPLLWRALSSSPRVTH